MRKQNIQTGNIFVNWKCNQRLFCDEAATVAYLIWKPVRDYGAWKRNFQSTEKEWRPGSSPAVLTMKQGSGGY